MKLGLHVWVACCMVFFCGNATAQNALEKTDTLPTVKKESYFKVNINYLSDAIYSGRKDSAVVPYLRSSAGYFNKSGFYINAGASLLVSPNDTKRIDLATLETGYNFTVSKKLEGSVTASKFFYTDRSYAVQSELKGMAGADLGYDAGLVAINAGADLLFSTNTDIFTSVKLSHYFETGPEAKLWSINPSVEVNAGTQYYNQAYYQNRKFAFATAAGSTGAAAGTHAKGHAHSSSSGNGVIKTLVFNDKNKFALLDYEMSIPVMYETRSWALYVMPTLALPVNAASYAVDGVLQKETLTKSFFMEVGAFFKLYPHHKKA